MTRSFFLFLCVLISCSAVAQQNEASLTLGGMFTRSSQGIATCEVIPVCPQSPVSVDIGTAFSVSAGFARRFADFHAASLHAEFPLLITPSRNGIGFLGHDFSTVFFTPSIRAQFAPSAAVSPFLSGGAGLAHFSGSGSDMTWTFQFGGGLDFKTPLPHFAIRVEARDFISGKPSIGELINVTSGHLQQVYAGGGVVIKF
jgi:hypothetical protein